MDIQMKELAAFLLSRASEEPETIKTAFRFYTACTGSYVTAEALMDILRMIGGPVPEENVPQHLEEDFSEVKEPPAEPDEWAFPTKKENKKRAKRRSFLGSLFRKRKKQEPKPGLETEEEPGARSEQGLRQEPGTRSEQPPNSYFGTEGWEEYGEEEPDIFPASGGWQEHSMYEDPFAEPDDGETVILNSRKNKMPDRRTAWLVPENIFYGESIELAREAYVIGRGHAEDVIDLGIRAVSRRHASLTARGETYELSDLGSKNGTFVNGSRLAAGERRMLNDGDVLRFAEAEYRFAFS